MLAALLQRLGEYDEISKERRSQYSKFADEAVLYIIWEAEAYEDGIVWPYYGKSIPDRSNIYNDGVHAAYIIDGLLTYAEHGDNHAEQIDREKMLSGLQLFRKDGDLFRYINRDESARLWGVGHLLHVLAAFYPGRSYTKFIREVINKYEQKYGFQPQSSPSKRGFGAVRHTAHLLRGLSSYEF